MCSQFVTWRDFGRLADMGDRKTKIQTSISNKKRNNKTRYVLCFVKKKHVERGKKIRKTYKWRVCNYRERQTQRWVVKYLPALGSVMGAVFSFHGPNHHTLAPQAPKPLSQQNIASLLSDSWCKHPPKSNVIRLSRCAGRKSASVLPEHEISLRFRPLECQVVQLCRLLFCVRNVLLTLTEKNTFLLEMEETIFPETVVFYQTARRHIAEDCKTCTYMRTLNLTGNVQRAISIKCVISVSYW